MKTKLHYLILIILIVATGCSTTDKSLISTIAERIKLPDEMRYPNGITHSPDGSIYVGSVVSGNIIHLARDGSAHTVFTETGDVFAGTSLRFDSLTNILWVASPDFLGTKQLDGSIFRRPHHLAAIAISDAQVIRTWTIPDKGFANDIALDTAGGVYVTDSINDRIYHLSSATSTLDVVVAHPLLQPGKLGPAGITRLSNGDLIIGLFSQGHLLRITFDKAQLKKGKHLPQITRLALQRNIENPDGIYAASDKRIIVLEGAVTSGNGKVLEIDLTSPEPHTVTELAQNIDSPLNLTIKQGELWVTEGRVRHLMLKDKNIPTPEAFYLRRLNVNAER